MSDEKVLNMVNGENKKKAPYGFSFTSLFFGPFVPLFRGDFKWTVIQMAVNACTAGTSLLVWPFVYNKLYIKDLIAEGYRSEDGIAATQSASEFLDIRIPRVK